MQIFTQFGNFQTPANSLLSHSNYQPARIKTSSETHEAIHILNWIFNSCYISVVEHTQIANFPLLDALDHSLPRLSSVTLIVREECTPSLPLRENGQFWSLGLLATVALSGFELALSWQYSNHFSFVPLCPTVVHFLKEIASCEE